MSVPASQQQLAPSTLLGRSVVLPPYVRPDLARTNLAIVNPLVAGITTVHTVPGGQVEIPQQITLTLVTSSAAANRFVGLQFKDGPGNVIGQTYMSGPQAASLTYNYTFMLDAGSAFVAGNFGIAPLPFMVMNERQSWHIVIVNADSGDQQDGLTHTEIAVPTGPQLVPVSVTPTPSPVLV